VLNRHCRGKSYTGYSVSVFHYIHDDGDGPLLETFHNYVGTVRCPWNTMSLIMMHIPKYHAMWYFSTLKIKFARRSFQTLLHSSCLSVVTLTLCDVRTVDPKTDLLVIRRTGKVLAKVRFSSNCRSRVNGRQTDRLTYRQTDRVQCITRPPRGKAI